MDFLGLSAIFPVKTFFFHFFHSLGFTVEQVPLVRVFPHVFSLLCRLALIGQTLLSFAGPGFSPYLSCMVFLSEGYFTFRRF